MSCTGCGRNTTSVNILSFKYLDRGEKTIGYIEAYLRAVGMYRNFQDPNEDPVFSQVVELDLGTVTPSMSGPKRPHDRVAVTDMKSDFQTCLTNKVILVSSTSL